ncbi:ABC transporter ATP-binding protein [Haloarchaeobius sp. DFWS5]|uniref:ABC transporter ATP-binding protein n=1 Tax=Haloarchaeobius sp. DFWS5 TaxID=3446114 RepID=UPI003EBFC484
MSDSLLRVTDLEKYYYENDTLLDRMLGNEKQSVKAVDGVSFDVHEGETLGLVGESGCGKSTTSETVLRLREATGGTVEFAGQNVFEMDKRELKQFRRDAQIVFQDPFSSLDPRMTVGEIVTESLRIHGVANREERMAEAADLLERVGLSANHVDRYPHEFSGGQRQRVGIARAIAIDPEFIVLDEPVSALDVSVQAQVLNLLQDLQDEYGLTYLFVAHDLSVVRHISDRVAVMYLGEIVETGPVDQIFDDPQHPYTQALLESVPRPSVDEYGRRGDVLSGDVPSPRNPPSGCRFHTRCPHATEACTQQSPAAYEVGERHEATCFRLDATHEYWDSDPLSHAEASAVEQSTAQSDD